jgi:hypothetical protein
VFDNGVLEGIFGTQKEEEEEEEEEEEAVSKRKL